MDVRWNYFIVKVEGIDQKITNETCRLNESEECHSNLNEEMKSTSRNHQSRQHWSNKVCIQLDCNKNSQVWENTNEYVLIKWVCTSSGEGDGHNKKWRLAWVESTNDNTMQFLPTTFHLRAVAVVVHLDTFLLCLSIFVFFFNKDEEYLQSLTWEVHYPHVISPKETTARILEWTIEKE